MSASKDINDILEDIMREAKYLRDLMKSRGLNLQDWDQGNLTDLRNKFDDTLTDLFQSPETMDYNGKSEHDICVDILHTRNLPMDSDRKYNIEYLHSSIDIMLSSSNDNDSNYGDMGSYNMVFLHESIDWSNR